jgi:hypothetical protein
MIVVPWPDDSISEDDHGLVRDLALHLAGAFLTWRDEQIGPGTTVENAN